MQKSTIGRLLGILVFIIMLMWEPPGSLSIEAWYTAATALLMGIWWITEAIPIAATALIPAVVFPVMGVAGIDTALAPYAHPLVFLFMGGFIIAIAMEKWMLHKRIALNIVSFVGVDPKSIVLGFILASAFLSMWVSNTATALMMLPIALSVLQLATRQQSKSNTHSNFALCLLLGVAFGCNIGGMGTLIGTPPNALLAGFMHDNYDVEISFASWLLFGLPFVVIALPILYTVLTRFVYPVSMQKLPGGQSFFAEERGKLGAMSPAEKRVAVVFIITAVFWITRPLLSGWITGLSDTGIAIAAGLSLFLIPAGEEGNSYVLQWNDAEDLPWGVLILFGGGLSLASAISDTGLAEWIGQSVQVLGHWPLLLLLLFIVAMIVFLTEMTSNTATSAAFLPIMGSVAIGIGQPPLLLALPVALSASCAFMLPVATPPNAIIYGSNEITIPQMVKAGVWLNFIFIGLVSLWTYFVAPLVFNL